MRFLPFAPMLAFATATVFSSAAHADSPNALDELKQGYALKQDGQCAEAIPHFLASYRLDPKPKALLNLADCEGKTGDLLAARAHAIQGRDLARNTNETELVEVGEKLIEALEKQTPRLTIRLTAGAPVGARIVLDRETPVKPSTSGVEVLVNPGSHHILATAPGRIDREFAVTLAQETRQDIEVQPGAALASSAPIAAAARQAPRNEASNATSSSTSSMRQVLTYGALGIGAVGIALGVVTGLGADSKHAALEGECHGSNCPSTAQADLDSFHSLKTWSTIGYVVGAAGLVGGAVLWFTSPKQSSDAAARLWIGPASTGVAGAF